MAQEEEFKLTRSPDMNMLLADQDEGYEFRRRRQEKWNEIYTLYRDTVKINRLTQRQSVNLPIMKTIIRTVVANSDDMPVIEFQSLDNDDQAEVFQNEYWKWTLEANNAEIRDIVDKRQEYLFGRTFDQWQIIDGAIKWNNVATEDILLSRYMDPTDIHSSRYLIHMHIFRPISALEANKDYDQTAVAELRQWFGTSQGLIKNAANQKALTLKNQKQADMGVTDADSPALGETIVELTLYFRYHKEEGEKEEQIYLFVGAEGEKTIMKKPLEKIIGETEDNWWRNHYPYHSWADDIEVQDPWPDGIGDIVLTPQKVANVWFSQMVENRTLKNFNMNVYDSNATADGWNPQTYTPGPFKWLPVPGKPGEVWQQLQVNDLGDTLPEMTFLIQMIEKAAGASSTQQGAPSERQITLGEVKLALSQAQERVASLTKFYTRVWKERAQTFLKLIEAAPEKLDAVRISKQGRNSRKLYTREISPKDWRTPLGYITKIWSQEEKNTEDEQALQKLNAVLLALPGNITLKDEYSRKLLEYARVPPDKITSIMEEEDRKRALAQEQINFGMMNGVGTQPGQQPTGRPAPTATPEVTPPIQ